MSSVKRWKYRIKHILESIEKIQQYTEGMGKAELTSDQKTLDAVIRNFQVIGEATRQIPDEIKRANPEIPWKYMERMRHILVHDYDRIDPEVVLDTIQKDLPALPPLLEQLLKNREE